MTTSLTFEAIIGLVTLIIGLPTALLSLFEWKRKLRHRYTNRQLQYFPQHTSIPSNEFQRASLTESGVSMTLGVYTLVEIRGGHGRGVDADGGIPRARGSRAIEP
ncbi:hypothetical protein F5Y00DRAFT_266216 [Daldinia vernicosa]|uniref:uncharacterized protein n=1 Tax=Daldinia vernicosa TaxID=114800 RepID=UPI0020075647|nr:uncharacterized protein F5Y00DRAFT_266216 [Daldinia vernicosa]KAI0844793.1 hypothetical protein F5Y00DRAFT_266216 [Daldinia vernicosa]